MRFGSFRLPLPPHIFLFVLFGWLLRQWVHVRGLNAFRPKVTELTNSNDIKKIYKYFNKLLRDKKNENYLDKIFFEIGEFEYSQNKIDLAIKNYNKSLKSDESSSEQKYLNYKKLAEIYYNDFREYEISKLYYDSTLENTNRENKEYKNLNDIRQILSELVENLNKIQENDSLINQLEKEKKQKEKSIENFTFNENKQEIIDGNLTNSTWYFYNDIVVSRGRDEFKRIWGNRKLTDNWRISRNKGYKKIKKKICYCRK